MNIYLTGQNNFGNRGCEALVRSTVDVIRSQFPDATFLVPSSDITRDSAQWPDAAAVGVRFVAAGTIPGRFIQWSRISTRLPLLSRLGWLSLNTARDRPPGLDEADVVLSIGGDNYSLDYDLASLAYFVAVAEAGLRRKIPVILWGASVGPFSAMPAVEHFMARHLRRLSWITVRETHSLAYLAGIGVSQNVSLVADSAFALPPTPVDVSAFWPQPGREGVLGLNVSPLVADVRARAGLRSDFVQEVARFIRATVTEQGLSVLLIPHVAPLDGSARNNDEVMLATIARACVDLGPQVRTVPGGMNAVQLKQIIGQCRYFIGARTHATIAALSMGVPTLSIAYSIKALGINRDLFDHEHYVLDTRRLDASSLAEGLARLVSDESNVHSLLDSRIHEWRSRAQSGVKLLQPSAAV
ncbi:MAG TPA: polysaccharide pyruvyl transferase family protein [Accumulibacter sp.]|uniref:polysaccharide pyruvyl transferase family protein n=1 Tax=Accumulibacter sp. TaxID=2053492 RepID=UPI002C25806D|nr:polysaccharide pyruvyl transferase family protein [Accumulibacter sp.]HRD87462.1 polysaccharide pyruvyl transferase family protein [Accumulibacter sp.]